MSLTVDRENAEKLGFAVFNGGEHVCVDLTDVGPATITVKTGDGQLVTFAFVPRHEGKGHQCVDIANHSGPKNNSGIPLQSASILGLGTTIAVAKPEDKATLVVLKLPERE